MYPVLCVHPHVRHTPIINFSNFLVKMNTPTKTVLSRVEADLDKPADREKRTVLLHRENFRKLQDVCRREGTSVSRLLDEMIKRYLEVKRD